MTFNEFKSKWDDMPIYGNSYFLVDSSHPIEFNMGYESLNQKTLLIVNSGAINNISSSKSIEAKNFMYPDGKWVLSFKLIRDDNEDVFLWFCWDMIESSRAVETGLIDFILNRYSKWLRLLEHKRSDLMDLPSQKGLVGELIFIEELTQLFTIEKAVNSWAGADGADQDFIYDDTWAEIKVTVLSSDSISISSIEQLDMVVEGKLVIYFIEKTSSESSTAFSLYEKVAQVRKLCEAFPHIKDNFELKLLKYGYRDEKEYDEPKYRLCKKNEYLVNTEFPKLTCNNVSTAIIQAKYLIDLVAIEKFKVI